MWGTLDLAFKFFTTKVGGAYDRAIHSLEAIGDNVAAILATLGTGSALGQDFSGDGAVERGASKVFSVGLTDNTPGGGPITAANIDITGATLTLEKSTGAGFSTAGITQPSISKVDGFVKVTPQFLDGEWAAGTAYALTLEGAKATAGGDVYPIRPHAWSGVVHETGDLESVLATLAADAASGFTSVDTKQDAAQLDLDALTDRPKSLTTATITDQDITTEKEITVTTQHTSVRDEVVKVQFSLAGLVSAAANYTLRSTILRGGILYDLGEAAIAKRSGLTALMTEAEITLESGDVLRSYVISDNAGDTTTPDATMEVYEVQ